jgi:hypothetical protein
MDSLSTTSERESITVSVVRTVSEHTDTPPTELPPLQDSLDVDALERIASSLDDGEVHFDHAGVSLTVSSDGAVEVRTSAAVDASAADD